MSATTTLEQRVQVLEALEAIRALKARYAALADAKYTPNHQRVAPAEMQRVARLQAECFSEEAVWHGGGDFGGAIVGRKALAEWFARSPWCFAMHYYASPSIEVDGHKATAQWRLWQLALREDTHRAVLLAAVTHEAYEQQPDGRWLHSSMRFQQVHLLPVSDAPDPLLAGLSDSNAASTREASHA